MHLLQGLEVHAVRALVACPAEELPWQVLMQLRPAAAVERPPQLS